MITVSAARMSELRTTVALLGLPVRLDVEGTTVVIHGPHDLASRVEVQVLRLVEQCTDDFRWCGDV